MVAKQKAEKEKVEAEKAAKQKLAAELAAKEKAKKEKIAAALAAKQEAAKEAKERADAEKAVKEKWSKEEAEKAEKKVPAVALGGGALLAGFLLYYFFKPASSSYDKPVVVLPINKREGEATEPDASSKSTDDLDTGVKAAFEATNVLNTVDQLRITSKEEEEDELEAQQLKEIAERANSLSTQMNKTTTTTGVDVSNQMNGTKTALDTSNEQIEGIDQIDNCSGVPSFEESVKLEVEELATDMTIASDMTTVSEESSKE